MASRIQIVVDDEEKERFRRQAAREGKSLSAWLREAARSWMGRRAAARLDSVDELQAFFDACDERETEPEPDWKAHRRVIERSARSGAGEE